MSSDQTLLPTGRTRWALRPLLLDHAAFALALVAAGAQTALLVAGQGAGGFVGLSLSVVGAVVSRRWVWFGFALIVIGPLIDTVLGEQVLASWAIAVFMTFSLCLRGLSPTWTGALVGISAYCSIMASEDIGFVNAAAFAVLAFALLAAATGSAVRSQSQYWNELEERTREAVMTRESEANRRVAEERLRIARDLHDVVGHEVAVLNVHLGVAEVSLPPNAGAAAKSLDQARASIGAILLETQRILEVLRTAGPDEDALRPAPSLANIPELIRSFREVGLSVDAKLTASEINLDPEVSTATYRITQEALTNAQRYGIGLVVVTLEECAGVLTLSVVNAKRERTVNDGGRRGLGLVGMRERATSAGGQLAIANGIDVFEIVATLRADGGATL